MVDNTKRRTLNTQLGDMRKSPYECRTSAFRGNDRGNLRMSCEPVQKLPLKQVKQIQYVTSDFVPIKENGPKTSPHGLVPWISLISYSNRGLYPTTFCKNNIWTSSPIFFSCGVLHSRKGLTRVRTYFSAENMWSLSVRFFVRYVFVYTRETHWYTCEIHIWVTCWIDVALITARTNSQVALLETHDTCEWICSIYVIYFCYTVHVIPDTCFCVYMKWLICIRCTKYSRDIRICAPRLSRVQHQKVGKHT